MAKPYVNIYRVYPGRSHELIVANHVAEIHRRSGRSTIWEQGETVGRDSAAVSLLKRMRALINGAFKRDTNASVHARYETPRAGYLTIAFHRLFRTGVRQKPAEIYTPPLRSPPYILPAFQATRGRIASRGFFALPRGDLAHSARRRVGIGISGRCGEMLAPKGTITPWRLSNFKRSSLQARRTSGRKERTSLA